MRAFFVSDSSRLAGASLAKAHMTIDQTSGEQPAIADDSTTTVVENAEAAAAVTGADDSSTPRKTGAEKRIDELTRLRREAERDRDYWREHATRQQPQPRAEPVASETPKPLPTLAEFDYDEAKYQAALLKHATTEAARQVREDLKREEADRQKTERVKSWKTRESEFKAKHDDYEDVAYYAPMSDAMVEIIQDSENGPELAYYLGSYREIAQRIAGLSPVQAAREIGRIEASLEKPVVSKTPAAAIAPKPVSKAPPPPPTIEATEPAVEKDPTQMTDKEFAKWRKKFIR